LTKNTKIKDVFRQKVYFVKKGVFIKKGVFRQKNVFLLKKGFDEKTKIFAKESLMKKLLTKESFTKFLTNYHCPIFT